MEWYWKVSMSKMKYTSAELKKFSLKELQGICKYYGLEYAPSWSKTRLVKELLAYSPLGLIKRTYTRKHETTYEPVYLEPVYGEPVIIETKKSVKIQRIEDGKGK